MCGHRNGSFRAVVRGAVAGSLQLREPYHLREKLLRFGQDLTRRERRLALVSSHVRTVGFG